MGGAQAATRHPRRAVVRGPRNLVNRGITGRGEGGEDVPNPSHRSALRGSPSALLPLLPGPAFSAVLTLAPALLFAWRDPAQNRWPALVLGLALVLDGAARIVARAVRRRTGVETEFRGLPSPMLALGNAAWIGGAIMAVGAGLRPDLFPLLACALAGLVAMGALARIALARMVVVIDAAERAAAEAKAEGTRR